MDYNAPS
ncbi:hypothetical protein SCAR479_14012 [Seiridium cardinale]